MSESSLVVQRQAIGREREPLIRIDGFSAEPDALRMAAIETAFEPAGEHYPGLRGALPSSYLQQHLPLIAQAAGRLFGRFRRIHVIDASFSIVTSAPALLHLRQRIPHVDAYGRERLALVHYLSPTNHDGTAFFRHRATGFETVDMTRAPAYTAQLDEELRAGDEPDGYIAGDTALFERTELVTAAYNRALIYRSCLLHSGAIAPDAHLAANAASGRLTVTGFLALE